MVSVRSGSSSPYDHLANLSLDLKWILGCDFLIFLFLFLLGKNVQQLPDNTLLIEKVKRQDAGMYMCQAQIRGRPVFKQLPISVVVNGVSSLHHHLQYEIKHDMLNVRIFGKQTIIGRVEFTSSPVCVLKH